MKVYRIAQYKEGKEPMPQKDFLDIFDIDMDKLKEKRLHEVVHEPESRIQTLSLYRGFDHLPEVIDGKYILSPERSEQGVLWFAHDFVTGAINGLEYARSHGKYLLTYPLQVTKHYQVISYDNSDEEYERIPQEFSDESNSIENCPNYMGFELPEGWYFSYKVEKFIICDHDLVVDISMVKENFED